MIYNYAQLSTIIFLSTLFANYYPRSSPAFLHCKQQKAGWGLGTSIRLAFNGAAVIFIAATNAYTHVATVQLKYSVKHKRVSGYAESVFTHTMQNYM